MPRVQDWNDNYWDEDGYDESTTVPVKRNKPHRPYRSGETKKSKSNRRTQRKFKSDIREHVTDYWDE